MSSSSTGGDGFLSPRASVEPEQLGVQHTDDALSAAISLLDLSGAGAAPTLGRAPREATPASTTTTEESQPLASLTPEVATALDMVPAELLVLVQEACLEHRYLRTKDISTIVERPERLRAVKIGVAAAFARLHPDHSHRDDDGDLQRALEGLDLSSAEAAPMRRLLKGQHLDVFRSTARLQISDAALSLAHPNLNEVPQGFLRPKTIGGVPVTPTASPAKLDTFAVGPKTYAEQLVALCHASSSAFGSGRSEVPLHLPQGDLYLCPGSESAILGALGACCEAVDAVLAPSSSSDPEPRAKKAFVSVRPPGHHCAESEPMGFCWVNNVVVAAAHAHLRHGIDRVVILDADLHHGNGTQDIVWKLNENAEREAAKAAAAGGTPRKGRSPGKAVKVEQSPEQEQKRDLRLFYGSLHDIFSYPCEDGDPEMVRDASVNLAGGHGQWISNIHLQPWEDEVDFFERLYPTYRSGLLDAAERFCVETTSAPDKTLVVISAGFDACEHESAGMSRHARNVPVAFYHRFSQDVASFADRCSRGRLVSVLEGGYSDRALTSATLSHLSGLAASGSSPPPTVADHPTWWELRHLVALEKTCKLKARKGAANGSPDEAWLGAAVDHFRRLEPSAPPANTTPQAQSLAATPAHTGPMTLRARKTKAGEAEEASPSSSLSKARARTVSKAVKGSAAPTARPKPPPAEVPTMPGGYATSASGSTGEAGTSDESRQTSATPPPSELSEATTASSDIAVPGGMPRSGIKFVWRAGGIQ